MSNPSFTTSGSLARALHLNSVSSVVEPGRFHAEGESARDSTLAGDSAAVRRLRSQVQRIAPHFRTALLRGEPGTGKQHVARAIHLLSPAADGPFVVANATALASAVAQTPKQSPSAGGAVFMSARDGILYLESIGELPPELQSVLYHFLKHGEERGVGIPERRARPRIVAETHRDLRTLAAVGHFRQDLYATLSAIELEVPALRHRIEDLPQITSHLLRRIADKTHLPVSSLAPATMVRLREYAWPGNLTELERSLAQAVALAGSNIIEPRHLLAIAEAPAVAVTIAGPVKGQRLHDVMQAHVLKVLTQCSGNKLRAAELLGISRSTLYRMLDAAAVAGPTME